VKIRKISKLFFTGDVSKDRGTKVKLLIEADETTAITGLAFKSVSHFSEYSKADM
jgi:hypothetical protein